jgi:predicted Zn-dependent protease
MIRSVIVVFAMVVLTACATSPTGRGQLLLFPESQMVQMGQLAFQEVKQKTPVSTNAGMNSYVQCVARAITRVVAPETTWEVTVFKDKSANAFALPGGKIGVNTGMLDVAENQHQLATVIGHEIAHVKANHSNARLSSAYATQAGLSLVELLAGSMTSQKQQLMGLLGLGVQVGILLPYSRGQESEADILGLEYMARAGFNPQESIALWQNMAKQGGQQPPAFLSTHPSHGSRIQQLQRSMPQALEMYRQARAQGRTPDCG